MVDAMGVGAIPTFKQVMALVLGDKHPPSKHPLGEGRCQGITLAESMEKRMIPVWITPESWQAFEESRRKVKAPLTLYAGKLIIRELCKLKAAGEDPQECLDQTIRNGWRDVFPVKDKQMRVVLTAETVARNEEIYQRQLEASIKAMR